MIVSMGCRSGTPIARWSRSQSGKTTTTLRVRDLELGRIVIVHDFAAPGHEQRGDFPNFYAWFRQAIEDFIAFDMR